MDFPITETVVSRTIARGGVCADEQGEFWAYHDLAYQQQEDMHQDLPIELADEIGLDGKAFGDCLGSEKAAARVERTEREARRLQLKRTPGIFVNGKPVIGHDDLERNIIRAVEVELAQ
uniref:Thioredoxin n=1 Tax=Candidatus Kentrum sp. LFY TaxID=2126342 RepID=A0A450UZL7_9GAMM|nr:MAG: Thioredoxin [Candidatus Kentron sp. LFY]